jgi:hypothetical protein
MIERLMKSCNYSRHFFEHFLGDSRYLWFCVTESGALSVYCLMSKSGVLKGQVINEVTTGWLTEFADMMGLAGNSIDSG